MYLNLGRTGEFLASLKNWLKIIAIFGYMSEEPFEDSSRLVHSELKEYLGDTLEIFLILQEKLGRVAELVDILKNTTKRISEKNIDYNELSDWDFVLKKGKIYLVNKKTDERIEI